MSENELIGKQFGQSYVCVLTWLSELEKIEHRINTIKLRQEKAVEVLDKLLSEYQIAIDGEARDPDDQDAVDELCGMTSDLEELEEEVNEKRVQLNDLKQNFETAQTEFNKKINPIIKVVKVVVE